MAFDPPLLELYKGDFAVIVTVNSPHEFLDVIIAERFAQSFSHFLELLAVDKAALVKVELVKDALD